MNISRLRELKSEVKSPRTQRQIEFIEQKECQREKNGKTDGQTMPLKYSACVYKETTSGQEETI